ncbi:imidazole glycerol phosphate synthase hisHF, chloroplastic-like isoform X3 [Elaeis guineensis]|uniref:imidazole glycerol phosphate synthase hisHF, chloroplastic-like isoform X3 n=1 Tax=Elaeis guineensis var. tenera TaxID=51953 RepID=UPI003C6D42AD
MEAPPLSSGVASNLRPSPLLPRLSPIGRLWNPREPCSKSKKHLSVHASLSQDSTVTLLDYGAGNVRSVRNAIRYLGFDIKDCQ